MCRDTRAPSAKAFQNRVRGWGTDKHRAVISHSQQPLDGGQGFALRGSHAEQTTVQGGYKRSRQSTPARGFARGAARAAPSQGPSGRSPGPAWPQPRGCPHQLFTGATQRPPRCPAAPGALGEPGRAPTLHMGAAAPSAQIPTAENAAGGKGTGAWLKSPDIAACWRPGQHSREAQPFLPSSCSLTSSDFSHPSISEAKLTLVHVLTSGRLEAWIVSLTKVTPPPGHLRELVQRGTFSSTRVGGEKLLLENKKIRRWVTATWSGREIRG